MTICDSSERKFGFVGIMGPTNAGKSTFLNQVLGQKLSIVTPKVQTTRTRILGIHVEKQAQIAFFDTPGLFKPKRALDESMIKTVWQSFKDVDISLLFFDVSQKMDLKSDFYQTLFVDLQKKKKKVALVLNKVDLIDRSKLLELSKEMNALYPFEKSFMISAKKGTGVQDILTWLESILPESEWMFEDDQLTDLPQKIYAAEVTREKLFLCLHQELPYQVNVQTELWQEKDNGSVRVEQVIYIKKKSHKGIILGHKGQQIKKIGQMAREEISAFLDRKVHLFLFVKVKENWDQDKSFLAECGF